MSTLFRANANASAASLALSLFLLIVAGCNSSAPSTSQTDGATATRGVPQDVTAEEVAQRMLDKYRDATSYADSAEYVQHYVVRGEGVERQRPFFELSLALERPNRLRLTLQEAIAGSQQGGQSYDVACDGEQLRVAVSALEDQVLVAPAPDQITSDNFLPDPMLRDTLVSQSLGNVFPQLAMLLNSSDDELVFPEDGPPELLPSDKIDGRPCYRLASESPAGRRVLWIDQEDATLRRMELPIAAQQEELDPEGDFMEHSVWIDFRAPTFDAEIDDATFELQIPEQAVAVTQLTPPAPEGPRAEIGREVSELVFYDAAGDKRPLTDYAGQVVVLDFWQIDCPPCKEQAPRLAEVRDALGDAATGDEPQVVFVGANVDRKSTPAEQIAKVWQSWGGDFPWLADRDRDTRELLNIHATPTLVVLDGDARVQLWQPGLVENPALLQQAIEDLLAGKDLAAEARAAHEARLAEHRREVESHRWEPAE